MLFFFFGLLEVCFHLEQSYSLIPGAVISFSSCVGGNKNTHIKTRKKAIPECNYISNQVYTITVTAISEFWGSQAT